MSISDKLDRQAAQERCEKATRGPWYACNDWFNPVFTAHARTDLPLALAELEAQDALIASQAAEMQTLRFDLQRANQAHETIERELFSVHSRQAALIQSMREALKNAPHEDECSSMDSLGDDPPSLCDCWKSRALAQVSASPLTNTTFTDYTVVLKKDDDSDVLAWFREIPSCIVHGPDYQSAVTSLLDIFSLFILSYEDTGQKVPEAETWEIAREGTRLTNGL